MSRPAGVTASAVVAIIGSALTLVTGVLMAVAMAMSKGASPAPVAMIGVAVGLICAGLAVLGGWTGWALLKMRPRARISILVFAGIMTVFSVLLMVAMILMPTPTLPDAQQNAAFDMMRPFFVGVYAIPLTIGVWWLVYFNRASTKAAFAAQYEPSGPPLRPLSISIIGWFSVVGSATILSMSLMRLPAFLAGIVMTGWTASIAYLVLGAVSLYLGWAVLKLKESGRKGMIVWYGLTMAHSVYVSLVPDVRARMQDLQRAMPFAATPSPTFDTMRITIASMLFGVMLGAVIIWLLVKERSRFT